MFGGVATTIVYIVCLNKFAGFELSYVIFGIIALILTIIGQIGDFVASAIKRYFDVKDFSNAFPGHGGFIDRIDSVIFAAPFAFVAFLLIL